MSENFDIGPLTWLKDEIYQSLDSVLENLMSLQGDIGNVSVMDASKNNLYQVSGALDLVGLEGCKLFCVKLENLTKKIIQKEIATTPALIEAFIKAVKTLKFYIQELLNGSPDIPLRLYDTLSTIVTAQGEMIGESELFFPDTSNSLPKSVPTREFSDEEYLSFIVKQRKQYQKSLLAWLQTKQIAPVSEMSRVVTNVCEAQNKRGIKTLWWVANAFTHTLASPVLAGNAEVKKLCRRLDQAFRDLTEGENRSHNNLLRSMLYFVAITEIDNEFVAKVREIFSLDAFIDKKSMLHVGLGMITAEEPELVKQLELQLEGLREVWSKVSDSLDFGVESNRNSNALIELDNVLVTKFANTLNDCQVLTKQLSQAPVADLFAALLKVSNVLRDDQSKVSEFALIEVAAALNLLDETLSQYDNLNASIVQQLLAEAKRLDAVAEGQHYVEVESDTSNGNIDEATFDAVVTDVKALLKVVEQALDTYFRNTAEKASLALTPKPLKQISAIFNMLNLSTPKAIVDKSKDIVRSFQVEGYQGNQEEFELLAESLSMIGMYIDEMPNVRPLSEKALEDALVRLQAVFINVTKQDDLIENKNVADIAVETTEVIAEQARINKGDQQLDKAFDGELLDIYLTEAEEVLARIAQNLQALRVNKTDKDALVEVKRSYHTLKGSGRTVGLVNLGEVAGNVEKFLNEVLDKERPLTVNQIQGLDAVTAEFSSWAEALKADSEVKISRDFWVAKVTDWLNDVADVPATVIATETPLPINDYVLIGGTQKVSRDFYDIFINESMQNITKLEQDVAKLVEEKTKNPSKAAHQSIHKLGSNALSIGIVPLGDLCRALENWLDETKNGWSHHYVALYESAVQGISRMWHRVSELKAPRTAKGIIGVLNKSAMQARNKLTLDVDLGVIGKDEVSRTEPVLDTTTQEDIVAAVETIKTTKQLEVAIAEPIEAKFVVAPEIAKEIKMNDVVMVPQAVMADEASDEDHALLNLFVDEAQDLLPEIGKVLRAWQVKPAVKAHLEALQRALHTFKGSARMAKQMTLGDVAHHLEEQVETVARTNPTVENFESMFVDLDKIGNYFEQATKGDEQGRDANNNEAEGHVVGRTRSQYLRLRPATLDRLINEAGEISIIRSRMDKELVGFKSSSNDLTDSLSRLRDYLRELEIEAETQMQSRMNILQEANEDFDPLEFDRFTRLQELTRMIAESVNDVGAIQTGFLDNLDHTEAALQEQGRMNRDLQQSLLSVRMLSFNQVTDRLRRIVRQTSQELSKSVDLVIKGEDLEIDRSMLDQLSAPLEHLLRNSVAHGIESASVRKKNGKPETGVIQLALSQINDEINIVIYDDGAGIDLQKVKEKAIKNKLIAKDVDISDDALLPIIFEPGFSTAEVTTKVYGRGVGLDVVRSDIANLGGRVDLSTERNKGTRFIINLPITQSVAQVLLIKSGVMTYALPVALIEQAQKIKSDVVAAVYAIGEIEWNDSKYPLQHLAKLLDDEEHQVDNAPYESILLLRSGEHTLALHVDEVLGNQEVVVKPIGVQLSRVPGVVGATVSGDGQVILLINPLQIAHREVLAVGAVSVKATKKAPEAKRQITAMVVDDSLTMRKMLSRSLTREGYHVIVAKDGMDAMQMLQENTPDIILTDIEMPRMDGFGLARNIRDDERTTKTPLIMISSRTADKHQNLAKEIGVDAFFGKPVQDDALLTKMKALLKVKK